LSSDSLPSACLYTVANAGSSVSAAEISDDSSLLALGFASSAVRVYSLLATTRLRQMRPADQLADLDVDADDVLHRMMDETSGTQSK